MTDHRTQHFRTSNQIFRITFGVLTIVGMQLSTSLTCADQPLTEISKRQAQAFPESIKQLFMSSEHVTKTFEKRGISSKTIAAQQQLINDLAKLLEQSGQSQAADDATTHSPSQTQNEGGAGSSKQSQKTETGSTAGQAPAVVANSELNIGDLNQRENFADAVWGHLPLEERNDLLRTYSESYLPGYEKRVQRYFEQLAKLQSRRTAGPTHEIAPTVSP